MQTRYGDRGAIVYFFCMPFVSYSSVRASEEFFKVFRSLWPLFASVRAACGLLRPRRPPRCALAPD